MKKWYSIALVGIVICGATLWGIRHTDTHISEKTVVGEANVAYYASKDLYSGVEQDNYIDRIPEYIYGGIVSHHLLAGDNIGAFFAEFRSQEVETIVVIGPNHYSAGDRPALVTTNPYVTPWGTIDTDTALVNALVSKKVATLENNPFREEHSISALVSYVAHNFPHARIVPIILKRNTPRVQLDDLATALDTLATNKTVVIASVDFSHHLNRVATQFHDEMSISALQNFDMDRLFELEVDSPPSLYTLLSYLSKNDARAFTYTHKNSVDYTGNLTSEDLTSYVFGHFTKGSITPDDTITSLHFGNMTFSGHVADRIRNGGDPFEHIQGLRGNFLRGADLIMGNVAEQLVEKGDCLTDTCGVSSFDTTTAHLLKEHGFQGVTFARDHGDDCHGEDFDNVASLLNEQNIFVLGQEDEHVSFVIKKVGTESLAIASINVLGLNEDDYDDVYGRIRDIKKTHTALIVHVHWEDAVQSLSQVSLAHRIIDAGADVIIGHHSSVIQPIEKYNDKFIFYAIGDLISDQSTKEAQIGIGVGVVNKGQAVSGYVFPYKIENAIPTHMPYGEMEQFCAKALEGFEKELPCSF